MNVDQLLDKAKLNELVIDEFISYEVHPEGGLHLYRWTNKARIEWKPAEWPEEALICNPLILNDDGFVVARGPLVHFFWDSYEGTIPVHLNYRVQEPVRGISCVLYMHPDGKPAMATDTFTGEDAIAATAYYRGAFLGQKLESSMHTHTPCFKAIIEGELVEFIMTGMVNDVTGGEMRRSLSEIWDWCLPDEESPTNLKAIRALEESTEGRGLDIIFVNGFRINCSYEEFMRLHRMESGCSAKWVWEYLSNNRSMATFYDRIPEEFHGWVDGLVGDLRRKYKAIEREARDTFGSILVRTGDENPSQLAQQITKQPNSSIMFAMWRKQDYSDMIWRQLKPGQETPYKAVIFENKAIPLEAAYENTYV